MSRENQMNNVGVFEMAERREKRAAEQQDMLARCGLPLVCINMNIAGPVKRGALIDWAFFRALNAGSPSRTKKPELKRCLRLTQRQKA